MMRHDIYCNLDDLSFDNMCHVPSSLVVIQRSQYHLRGTLRNSVGHTKLIDSAILTVIVINATSCLTIP